MKTIKINIEEERALRYALNFYINDCSHNEDGVVGLSDKNWEKKPLQSILRKLKEQKV